MPGIDYENFDLSIEREGQGYHVRVSHPRAGQADAYFHLSASEFNNTSFLRFSDAREFGTQLFDTLFADRKVYALFGLGKSLAGNNDKGLRVRLMLKDVPELAVLPWEYLYDSDLDDFLVLSNQTSLVRYLQVGRQVPLPVKPPLKVLAIVSAPHDYPPVLDAGTEWDKVRSAFAQLKQHDLVIVERLDPPTVENLQHTLANEKYHIMHYHGHGGFNEKENVGALILEDEQGNGYPLKEEELGRFLMDEPTLQLVLLNACESGRGSGINPFDGLAQTLVRKGKPAVIAMQFKIGDDVAHTLAREFYKYLADNHPVDAALAEARKAGRRDSEVEWGTPVLYMHSPDGRIFDIVPTSAAMAKAGTSAVVEPPSGESIEIKPSRFVGREAELQKLVDLVQHAAHQRGSIVFLEGRAGMGTTTFLNRFQKLVRERPELGSVKFVGVKCDRITGSENAYQPFVDILSDLADPTRNPEVANKVSTVLQQVAPDWLQLVPDLVPATSSGDQAAPSAERWLAASDQISGHRQQLTSQYLKAVRRMASLFAPLALIIEDAHHIDDASCQLLSRLAEDAANTPLLALVTCRPEELHEEHPLYRVQQDLTGRRIASTITLQSLTREEIEAYLERRYGHSLHPDFTDWLHDLCKGIPLFLAEFLNVLEREKIIRLVEDKYILDPEIRNVSELVERLEDQKPPADIQAVLKDRIRRLAKEDLELLQVASVQGQRFFSAAIIALLKKGEPEVLDRLHQVEDQADLIEFSGKEDWVQKSSEVYAFDHLFLQQLLYSQLKPHEQRLNHTYLAEVMENALEGVSKPSRRWLLEIANHYGQAGEWLRAAQYYYRAARSSFLDGAIVETDKLCRQALEKAEHLQEGVPEHDRLHAQIILLLLDATELYWRGKIVSQGDVHLHSLIEEAEAAALRTDDESLLAQVKFAKGKMFVATNRLPQAITTFTEARQLAHAAGDRLGEFVILSALGHHLNSEDLTKGVETLYEAYELYKTQLVTSAAAPADLLEYNLHVLEGRIGVAEFDRGNFDQAVKWLQESIHGLKKSRIREKLLWMFNFLAQAWTAMGLFEQAEDLLHEALDLQSPEEKKSAVGGNNLALLGKLYLEWERFPDAVEPLRHGWAITEEVWNVAVVPLVRNYYAELLMHPGYEERDLAEADRLLVTTLEETRASGFHRSAIAALTLRSRLALMQNRISDAVAYSTQAVAYLERMGGTVPALRSEEVLFNHYSALRSAGRQSEAQDYLKRSHDILKQKADTISDPEGKRSFLERVPVSRDILSAVTATEISH